jgi:hypothetical protein
MLCLTGRSHQLVSLNQNSSRVVADRRQGARRLTTTDSDRPTDGSGNHRAGPRRTCDDERCFEPDAKATERDSARAAAATATTTMMIARALLGRWPLHKTRGSGRLYATRGTDRQTTHPSVRPLWNAAFRFTARLPLTLRRLAVRPSVRREEALNIGSMKIEIECTSHR